MRGALAMIAACACACGSGGKAPPSNGASMVTRLALTVVPAIDAGGPVSLHMAIEYRGRNGNLQIRTTCMAAGRRWIEDGSVTVKTGTRRAGAFTSRALPAAPDWCEVRLHRDQDQDTGPWPAFCARRDRPAEPGACRVDPEPVAPDLESFTLDRPRIERTPSRLRVLTALRSGRVHAELSFVRIAVACGAAHDDVELPVHDAIAGDWVMPRPVDLDPAKIGDAPCAIVASEAIGGVTSGEALGTACYQDGAVHDGPCT